MNLFGIKNKKIYFFFIIVCLFSALALRLFLLFNTAHLDYESNFRIIFSQRFSDNPFNLLKGVGIIDCGTGGQQWFYFFNSFLMHIFNNDVLIARLSSLIFGMLAIIPYYLLIKSVFSVKIALASLFALVFYSVHIQLSVVPMGNIGSIFFIILAALFPFLYLDFKYLKAKKIFFFCSILFTILATSFRLEAWLFVFIFPAILILEKKVKEAAVFFILSSFYIFRTISMLYFRGGAFEFLENALFNPDYRGNFDFFATRSDISEYYGSKYQFSVWFYALRLTFSYPLLILGFIGMVVKPLSRRKQEFLLLFWSSFFLLTVRQIISNQYPYLRYSALLGIFFIPFIFLGFSKTIILFSSLFKLKKYKNIIINVGFVLAGLYFAIFSIQFISKEINNMRHSPFMNDLKDIISEYAESGDIVITSLTSLDIGTAIMLNDYISRDVWVLPDEKMVLNLDFYDSRGMDFYDYLASKGYSIDKKIYRDIARFAYFAHRGYNAESINLRFIDNRIDDRVGNLIFILDSHDMDYLENNFSELFLLLKIKTEFINSSNDTTYTVAVFGKYVD